MGLIIHRRLSASSGAPSTNLEHWWTFRDADITESTGISNVTDRQGSSDLTQATGSAQPTSATSINSLETADHDDASSQTLASAAFTGLSTPYVVAGSFKFDDLDGTGSAIVGYSGVFEFGQNGSGAWEMSDSGATVATGGTADTSSHYFVCRVTGDSSAELRLDGSSIFTGDVGSASMTRMGTAESYHATFANVNIGEIILYSGDKSGSGLTELETYLSRWTP